MRILITGATGYIGQHVAMAAAERGWDVHALVRPGSSTDRLVAAVPGVHLHTAEPTAASLALAVAAAAPDVACHVAADSRAQVPAAEMADQLAANVTYGTLLAQALIAAGCRRFVNTGSWWEYDELGGYAPNSLYAASKRAFQDILAHYARQHAMAIVTLVPFDVYGPGDWRGKLLPSLVAAARRGETMATTAGEQMMDLVHVADVAQGFVTAAERTAARNAAGRHQVFALSSGRHTSLRDVVGILEAAFGRPIEMGWGQRPYPPHQVFQPTDRLPNLPGWQARRSLEDGLAELVNAHAEAAAPGEAIAEKGLGTSGATERRPGIFYFITWHQDLSSLVRMLYYIYDERNYYYISIGGNYKRGEVSLDCILQAPNITVYHGRPVSWGGPRLLFDNVLTAMRLFLDLKPECQWFQVLCNQSFPLLSQNGIRSFLVDSDWMERHSRPPAWKPEFLDDPDGHGMMPRMLHDVFSACSIDPVLQAPTFLPSDPAASNFNFTAEPRSLDSNVRGAKQRYMIMPQSADMRGLAFNKYIEFLDLTEEDRTYVRMLSPHAMRWVHSVFRRYPLHSGDPFLTACRTFARFVLEDDRAQEIHGAMCHQFGPEMNFFDTIKHNFPPAERGSMSHNVWNGQAGNLAVTEDDIEPSEKAAANFRRMFIRKVTRPAGVGLARHFGERIEAERPEDDRRWSLALIREPGAAGRRVETFAPFAGSVWRLRTLTGDVLGELRPQNGTDNGKLLDGSGEPAGHWWRVDGAIRIALAAENGRVEFYRRASASGGRLILVPDEVVGVGNGWGRFLDQPLEDGFAAEPSRPVTVNIVCRDGTLHGAEEVVREGKSALGLVLDAHSDVPDDPMLVVTRHRGVRWDGLERDETGAVLARLTLGDTPQRLELAQLSVSPERSVLVFRRPVAERPERVPVPADGAVTITLDEAALCERRWVVTSRLFSRARPIHFRSDRRVEVECGGAVGYWRLDGHRLLLADVADWRLGELTQFVLDEGRWRMAGYGQYDLAEDDCLHIVERDGL
ncbi:NAD-dependent epimerase/dehydratase family protein [Azospirillum rugosum]|uniref:Nucleoside-diphosphate-sugar epimerase n=1 Tax=Azospirillum rugosum TaxID=416170 RepID=A0ABS4SQM4_9PROT|nr:NAD-dependent epimerase/dehydratase family protein [Azospirillum rugosum]MBP2294262.1 nucleoside-diphosphate-sugar epimerase [Azospirillum rugosum]MDQ0527597.1 nucleoside-diphosphate-sugar epimerase [Azospirillum rugosum]